MLNPHWWFHILRSLNKGVRNHNYCLTKHTINIHIYFIGTEIYPQKSQWIKFVLILNVANQEYERQNFTVKNYRSSNQQRERRNFTNDEWTYWRERHARAVAQNPRALKMAEGRFASVYSVEEFIIVNRALHVCLWIRFELFVLERYHHNRRYNSHPCPAMW